MKAVAAKELADQRKKELIIERRDYIISRIRYTIQEGYYYLLAGTATSLVLTSDDKEYLLSLGYTLSQDKESELYTRVSWEE